MRFYEIIFQLCDCLASVLIDHAVLVYSVDVIQINSIVLYRDCIQNIAETHKRSPSHYRFRIRLYQ